MTTTFARIRFHLPRDRRINADTKTFAISNTELPTPFEIVALDSDVLSKASNVVLRSGAFETPDAAAMSGRRAEQALMIAAAKIRLGIDLGTPGARSGFLAAGLEMVRAMNGLSADTAVVNDALGLTLVDASRKAVFAGVGAAQLVVGTPVEQFAEAFIAGYALAPFVSDRSALALELFSASRFEGSVRARFLTLVSAVECIATRPPRGGSAVTLVRSFQNILNQSLVDDVDRSQLQGSLQDLERRSITGTCKALVEDHCVTERARLFVKCYHARSKLVHEGRTEIDIGAHVHDLEQVVGDTIIGSIMPVA